MSKNRLLKLSKTLHKWPAIIIAFIAILFAFSGIVMNHRGIFSGVDVSRYISASRELEGEDGKKFKGGFDYIAPIPNIFKNAVPYPEIRL